MKRIGSFLSRCAPLGLIGCCALATAQVQKTVSLSFAKEGDREVWIGSSSSPGTYVKPQSAQGTGISLDIPDRGDGLSVFVHDKATGNVAVKSLSDVVKLGTWKVEAKDEALVRQLDVLVTYDAKPVASALVRAKAGNQTREALLSPTDKGHALLYNLPPGPVEVTVDYKTKDGPKSTPAQTFQLKLGAGPGQPKTIAVTDEIDTVTEPTATKAGDVPQQNSSGKNDVPSAPPVPAPNPALTFVNSLLGIAVIGGICYGIYTYIKKNPQQFEDTLKKAGIGAPAEPPVGDVPPPPSAPQPIKPIMLDDAVPSAVVQPMPLTLGSAATAVKTPRLVKADGSVVLLMDGANIVGREEGLQVALVGESSVSRQHASLEKSGDEVTLSDLGSTNGTFVNGSKLSAPTLLSPGDNVQFGAVAYRYEV